MTTKIPAAIPTKPKIGLPAMNANAAQPNDSVVRTLTKMRWKAFSDISMGRARRKILQGIKRQSHQPGKKKYGETEQCIDHFLFRNQVHEKSGDDESVGAGDRQDYRYFHRPADLLQKRRPNHQRRRANHGNENIDAA